MNRYETWISNMARSVVTTATQTSEALVSVAMAMIAVVSAVPEFMGLWSASGSVAMGLAIAATGAGSAHGAARSKKRAAIGVFVAHIIVAEVILWGHGAYAEMAYPLVTAIGAAVMALSVEHHKATEAQSVAETLQAEADERERVRAEADEADRKAEEAWQRQALFDLEIEQKRLDAAAQREREQLAAEANAKKCLIDAEAKRIKAEKKSLSGASVRQMGGGESAGVSPEGKASPEEMLDTLSDYVQRHPGQTGGQIAKAHGGEASTSTIYRALTMLEAQGSISHTMDGRSKRWAVTIAPALPAAPAMHLNGNGVTNHDQP